MQRLKRHLAGYWNSFSFIGLVFATLLFCVSVTPSLLPRNYVVQGLLSGFSLAIGYGFGVALVAGYRFLGLREPTGMTQRNIQRGVVGVVAVIFVIYLWRMTGWQNSIRDLMELPPLETAYPYRVAIIAILFGAVLVAACRLFLAGGHWVSSKLERWVPHRIARAIGFSLMALLLMFLSNDVIAVQLLDVADAFFLNLDQSDDDDLPQPTDPEMTGSDESLVSWESIGRQGKSFLVQGPTRMDIAQWNGSVSEQPIRVYVGMRSRPTVDARAELALQELKRVGGFDRKLLVIATPTGTGWLDPSAVDTLEYMHGGDCAIVSMQYSYLPSWITILVDPQRSIESGQALFETIYGHWKTLPKDARPKLYLHGLSLGSLGSESSADLFTIFEDPIDGAVWSGPPFPSHHWKQMVQHRNPGSPAWLPKFRDGRMLRFTSQRNALQPELPWGPMRSVYIQYASDPMIWFSPDLAWSHPAWLQTERGPDVSPGLRWFPVVTFLQVAFDLPMATTVPLGYGHNYSPSSYIDAWVAVTEPSGWSDPNSESLKALFQQRQTPKP